MYYVTERVSTGSKPLDDLLRGGLERGIITNVFGKSGTGKTNICIQAAAHVSSNGGGVVYIDTEKGFSTERFSQITDEGDDNVKVLEPVTFEEQEEKINSLRHLTDSETDLIVVDSLVSLYRLKANNGNVSEMNQRLSKQLSELSKQARRKDIPVLVTNQVYSNFDEEGIELVGRDVPRYWSKCLLKVEYIDRGVRNVEIEKHRSMPEGRNREFMITDSGLVETE